MSAVKTHVVYRPKPGKEAELLELVKKHGPALESTGLSAGGLPQLYRARNVRSGQEFFVEIFSWRDEEASGKAHQTPEIMAVWGPMTPLLDSMEISVLEPVA